MNGIIIGRDIVYDGTRVAFPTAVPYGNSAIVSISSRNESSTAEKIGIYWTVRDPDGNTSQEYEMWTTSQISAGGVHVFEGGYINLNIVGEWRIDVFLLMNQAAPVIVDQYNGLLCDVLGSVEEFKGVIVDKRFIYDGESAAFGSEMYLLTKIQVQIQGQNQMGTPQDIGAYWVVNDPLGFKVQEYYLEYWRWVHTPAGLYAQFTGLPFNLGVIGSWSIEVQLLMNPASPVIVDSWQGEFTKVLEETKPPPGAGEFPWIPVALGASGLIILASWKKIKT